MSVATPASAGGSWLEPAWDRVEAGQSISLSADISHGQLGWVDDGPFYAYLSGETYGKTLHEGTGGAVTDVSLGELVITERDRHLRASIDFTLAEAAPPGEYWIVVCNDPCTTGLGDLIGGFLFVGMNPRLSEVELATAPNQLAEASLAGAVAITQTADPLPKGNTPAYLALAPHRSRPTGLSAAWMATSAGLAALVLGFAFLSIRRSGTG